MNTPRHPGLLDSALIDWEGQTPVSRTSGDVYFSRRGGVAESRFVFLDGNDLGTRFAGGSNPFCVAETGFGTGLNFLLARQAFLARAPGHRTLHFVSFEHAPLARHDRRRFAQMLATGGDTRLADDASMLDARMPPPVAGWHRVVMDGGRVRLSIWFGDAAAGLADWRSAETLPADAWFLDGYAPSRAPGLWSPALMRQLGALSHRRTTLATFSVAASVREALTAAGFDVRKRPGPLGKREMLVGTRRHDAPPPAAPQRQRITVVGAGLAGAAAARACAERGHRVRIVDAATPASGASGNRHAVLHPRLPLEDGPRGPFLLTAYAFARTWLRDTGIEGAFTPREVLQYSELRRPERLARVRARFAGVDDLITWRTADALQACMSLPDAGVADLPRLVAGLLAHPGIEPVLCETLDAVEIQGPRWQLRSPTLARNQADIWILATGAAAASLLRPALPLGRMRGQVSRIRGSADPRSPVLTGRGHAVPLADGWSVGSSYVRDGDGALPSDEERAANLDRHRAWSALRGVATDQDEVVEDWVGVRGTAPDRAPVIGELAPGLWCTLAHASSGLTTCPLAAEAIAAAISGEPPALDADTAAMLHPGRFADLVGHRGT